MSLFSCTTVRALIACGSLFSVGQSYASEFIVNAALHTSGKLECNAGRYVMSIYNDSSVSGNWYVACNNGYTNEAFTLYAQPYAWGTVGGNFGGKVVCTVTGNGFTVTDSVYCS